MIPSQGQVSRTELLCGQIQGVQELEIHIGRGFCFVISHLSNIQSMVVFTECFPVVRPGPSAAVQPADTLEHTLSQNDIYIFHLMLDAPDIGQVRGACHFVKIFEINAMEHSLDIGHTDLEGSMYIAAAVHIIHCCCILLGDQSLAVKSCDLDAVHSLFYPAE